MQTLKGWKTVGFGLLVAIVPTALTYAAGLDWTKLVGPNAAAIVVGLVTVALRAVTDTPVGKSS